MAFNRALVRYHDASPDMRRFLALADLRYPSAQPVAPSLGAVLPVVQRLAERARSDPSAGVALPRFVAMTVRMDVEAAGASAAGATATPP